MLFNEKDPEKEKMEKFAASCKPLEELLDSVRDIEGFPIGRDEDILALSNAPNYTACPNPYIKDFIETFGEPYDEDLDTYDRKPFLGDISEGKKDPIYNAHSYHTKVPYKAIMKFIEHYTKEGDIVFDGFCGTGMAGIAAQISGRRAILLDLSPIATSIAYNINNLVNSRQFDHEAKKILQEAEKECGWLYETIHSDGITKGKVVYTIYSDVFICSYCKNEYILWKASVDNDNNIEKSVYECPNCKAKITKSDCERSYFNYYDKALNAEISQVKQVPVLISYSVKNKRFWKEPDNYDFELLKKIDTSEIPYWYPTSPMMNIGTQWGDTWRAGYHFGINNAHHFYSKRNLWVLSKLYDSISKIESEKMRHFLMFFFTSLYSRTQKMNRYMPKHNRHVGPLSGTLYISSFPVEINVFDIAENKKNSMLKLGDVPSKGNIISTQSLTGISHSIPGNSVDYIFTDPPFGDNLMYSELNFISEAWLKVLTNNKKESIINQSQNKSLVDYKELMQQCFYQYYRVLKPNRWITVEFHNSRAAVWNAIQDTLSKAGFIIAQVAVIDKQKGTTKQLTYAGSVNKDLVINAYKPKKCFEEKFLRQVGEGLERDFVEEHLNHLPIEPNIERSEKMLYSKLLAHYVQHGYEIKLNAKQFYEMLMENFKLIDNYWFLDNQIANYEEWKKGYGLKAIKEIHESQLTLFVNDEKSSLIWLYNFLEIPKSYSDILTAYNQITTTIEDEIPELRELLDTNFIFENGIYRRPLTDKERARNEEKNEKELLKTFEKILMQAKFDNKKIKSIRKEAIKLGFTKAYQEKRFEDILTVAKKLNIDLLENNSEINDFVEIARMKTGE